MSLVAKFHEAEMKVGRQYFARRFSSLIQVQRTDVRFESRGR